MDKYEGLITLAEKSQSKTANWNGGAKYSFSHDLDDERAFELVTEFVDLAKKKGLTIRQAQQIFLVCSDYVLENALN